MIGSNQASSPEATNIIEVSEATFQRDVLEYSVDAPVIVDFWADWCQPCRTLTPMLEALCAEYQGVFRLAKIDVERNQQLAMALRIQSIPTLVALSGGQVVDQVVGGLPQAQLKQWVEAILKHAGVEAPKDESTPSDPIAAEAHWRATLEKDGEDAKALLALGRLLINSDRAEDATALLERVPATAPEYGEAQAALSLLALLGEVAAAGGETAVRHRLEADPDDLEARYLMACADAGRGNFLTSLQVLVGMVGECRGDERARAKAAAGKVFATAGREDAEVEALRRELARLLF